MRRLKIAKYYTLKIPAIK